FAIWSIGKARTFSEYAQVANRLPEEYQTNSPMQLADEAVRLSPADPEAHYARGVSLLEEDEIQSAIVELRRAVVLRPRAYKLWVKLGSVCEEAGDENGAIVAYSAAIRRAPYYAQPRWQLGNLFLRTGQLNAAFFHLRFAAESDPSLL